MTERKLSSWIIPKINIISAKYVSRYTHPQNDEQRMKRRKEIKISSVQCPRFAENNCVTRELQKKASEPAAAPAGAEPEPQVLAVAVAVPQEQYSEGVRQWQQPLGLSKT